MSSAVKDFEAYLLFFKQLYQSGYFINKVRFRPCNYLRYKMDSVFRSTYKNGSLVNPLEGVKLNRGYYYFDGTGDLAVFYNKVRKFWEDGFNAASRIHVDPFNNTATATYPTVYKTAPDWK